jgi:hypothetical protein
MTVWEVLFNLASPTVAPPLIELHVCFTSVSICCRPVRYIAKLRDQSDVNWSVILTCLYRKIMGLNLFRELVFTASIVKAAIAPPRNFGHYQPVYTAQCPIKQPSSP